ncbi:YcaO-like family protein [Paralimibaculum aggregatum]|uniref:YcaO-like family protein n=2 Tax=Paralimibaculum aggregatum TaxID=3036245 RepID=A0ABQ6LMJ0_9RHOB|nr:YcaO-like family protein [Limibaculum sp. NKW23]
MVADDPGPTGDKRYRRGTRRSCTPAETWARLRPLLPVFGITRVANLTGLDRIGIPVFQACRPNARSLSVYQGKGLDADAARVSAVMEAIETHCAEAIHAPLVFASAEAIRFSHPLVDVERLPLTDPAGFDPYRPIMWIEGEELLAGGPRWLPFEMVHANYALPEPPQSGVLTATTNGLASGNTRDEALLHALLEVIERDAETLWKLGPQGWGSETAIDPAGIDDPHCRALIARFAAARIDLAIWDITSDTGVPAFLAMIDDPSGETGAPEIGAGAHLAPEVALARALTEAAQARLTYIAGAREDIAAEDYAPEIVAERHRRARAIMAGLAPRRRFADVAGREADSLAEDVAAALAALAAVGIAEVVAVELTAAPFAVPVMRVVVPGLEAALEGPDDGYVPGARAAALLADGPR